MWILTKIFVSHLSESLKMPSTIVCPDCQSQIAIDEVLTSQLSARLRAEMEQEIRSKNHDLEESALEAPTRAS